MSEGYEEGCRMPLRHATSHVPPSTLDKTHDSSSGDDDSTEDDLTVFYLSKKTVYGTLPEKTTLQQYDQLNENYVQRVGALAAISILFHDVWPNAFPHASLGLEMLFTFAIIVIFVIAGFTCARFLLNSTRDSITTISGDRILAYYVWQIRNLVPVYILFVYAALQFAALTLSEPDFWTVCVDAVAAMLYGTNIVHAIHGKQFIHHSTQFHRGHYLPAYGSHHNSHFHDYLFAHTWAVSVLAQMIAIAPLLLYAITWLADNLRIPRHQTNGTVTGGAAAIGIVSLALNLFIGHAVGMPFVAFNLVFCRLWQPFAGVLAYCNTVRMRQSETTSADTLPSKVIRYSVVTSNNNEKPPTSGNFHEVDLTNSGNVLVTKIDVPKITQGVLNDDSLKQTTSSAAYSSKLFILVLLLVTFVLFSVAPLAEMDAPLQITIVFSSAALLCFRTGDAECGMFCGLDAALRTLGDAAMFCYLLGWPLTKIILHQHILDAKNFAGGLSLIGMCAVFSMGLHRFLQRPIARIRSFRLVLALIALLYALSIFFIFVH